MVLLKVILVYSFVVIVDIRYSVEDGGYLKSLIVM